MQQKVSVDPIDIALDQARAQYVASNPLSMQAHARATRSMPGGNTRSVLYHAPFPLRIDKGNGSRIFDADGHSYLNLLGEYTAGMFGHNHPVIRKAIDRALDHGINLSAHNPDEIRLAELVCQRFSSIEKVRFTNSGTEANLMAISTARVNNPGPKVMVFEGGYHGGLLYFKTGGIPINAPFEYVTASYNNIDQTRELIRTNAPQLSCIMVEPMLGSAGCLPATADFLTMLREEASATDTILIFDEVMTSRLSSGGAQSHYQITPDMTTLGKYIGGGMSFGAFGGQGNLMQIYNPESSPAIPHAGTFNNNSLSMAAGCAALGQVYTATQAHELNQRGNDLRERLNNIAKSTAVPVCFSGIGSLMNLHGTAEPVQSLLDIQHSDQRLKTLFFFWMLEQGYYLAPRGFIALMLPTTDNELSSFAESFAGQCEKLKRLIG